jgi:spore coat protein A, manganese oxidase
MEPSLPSSLKGYGMFASTTRVRRRGGLLGLLFVAAALFVLMSASAAASAQSPSMGQWVDPLPMPPVAQQTFKPGLSLTTDYYDINMTASQYKFNRDLGPATVWTYGQPGKTPVLLGPTIVATSGRPVIVHWINDLPTDRDDFPLEDAIDPTIPGFDVPTGAATPHLHGGHTAARYDGTPMEWWTADGKKGPDYVTNTFKYMNDQPASMLWYHDHTMGSTRFKPYLGLAAAYLIFDKVDNGKTINGQKVPAGYGKYQLPIVLQDKEFNADGSLFYPTQGVTHPKWVPEFFGDTPVINGKAYPYLDAQPRRYRLRMLNGSQARFYNVHFNVDGTDLPFAVIGSEGGLLPKPAIQKGLLIAPGERYDVIVDFTGVPLGSTVMMTNDAAAPYPEADPDNATLPELLKINVNTPVPANDPDRTVRPRELRLPAQDRLRKSPGVPARDIVLKENTDANDDPTEVLLNGYHFMDPTTDFIKAGTTETWRWINLTVDAHPMHMHLETFQVVNRQAFDVDRYKDDWAAYLASGRKPALKPVLGRYLMGMPEKPAPDEMGFKDTVKAYPGYVTRVRAKFTLPSTSLLDYNPKTGSYGTWVYHCHILEHEENDMMRPFEVVK